MTVDDISLVIKREGQYFSKDDTWVDDPREAWPYATEVAFVHAKDFGGEVFLRCPRGREIKVEWSDFSIMVEDS